MSKGSVRLVGLGAAALAVATLAASIGGDVWWPFGLVPHFRPHLMMASVLLLLIAVAQRRRVVAAAGALMLIVNSLPVLPYMTTTRPAVATTTDGTPLRVMTFNLHVDGTRPEALVRFIRGQQPDVILLTELPKRIDWLMDPLWHDYPHRMWSHLENSHDVMLLSRWPIKRFRRDYSAAKWLPVASAILCAPADPAAPVTDAPAADRADESCIRFIGMHAVSPFGKHAAEQTAQFARATDFAKSSRLPVVMAGDFNAAPWSPVFRRLFDETGMVTASRGHGLTATWSSRLPMIGLMIDHVLTSPDIASRGYLVGDDLGSDHHPVVADLMLPAPKPKAMP